MFIFNIKRLLPLLKMALEVVSSPTIEFGIRHEPFSKIRYEDVGNGVDKAREHENEFHEEFNFSDHDVEWVLVNKIINDKYNKELDNEVEDILFYAQDSDNESGKKIKIVYNNDE